MKKTHRAFLDVHTSSSLIAPEILKEELKSHKTNKNDNSKWKTGMGGFEFNGTVNTLDATLPEFTTQRKLDMLFSMLPERTNHACHFIIGM